MISPIIPFRSGRIWAGRATGSRSGAGHCTASSFKKQRDGEGKQSNNEISRTGVPLLHRDLGLRRSAETRNHLVHSSQPTAPHPGCSARWPSYLWLQPAGDYFLIISHPPSTPYHILFTLTLWQQMPTSHRESQSIAISRDGCRSSLWTRDRPRYLGFSMERGCGCGCGLHLPRLVSHHVL